MAYLNKSSSECDEYESALLALVEGKKDGDEDKCVP